MKIKILRVSTDDFVGASIVGGEAVALPSIHTGWRFNFDKHSKSLTNARTYILVADETPGIIEGCLIFQMLEKKVAYMAFVEIAPHNRNDPKKYEYVAGCLIAFAFKQSVIRGKGDYKAQLFFDVQEQSKQNEQKLIAIYRRKYNAIWMGGTRLVIMDEAGYDLIEKYLNRNSE